jgi:predicted RNase H-like HicB family nuclease
MRNEFTAVIERAAEGGYWGYCPEIPGANGQGESIDECRQNLREAIALVLQDRRDDGLRGAPEDAIRETVALCGEFEKNRERYRRLA